MQVAKWGNSLAIRLHTAVVEALQLREGDDKEVVIVDVRVFAVSKKPRKIACRFQVQPQRCK